jgi:hypothetical protein
MTEESKEQSPQPRDYYAENAQKDIERKQRMEKGRLETRERLKTDPAIQDYFQSFNPYMVEQFIKNYPAKLQIVKEYGQFYTDQEEQKTTEYMQRANVCLAEILAKKLFDMRLDWGAGKLQLEGIRTSADFTPHETDVMNSTLIPPITHDEFYLYMDYAKSSSFKYEPYGCSWISLVNQWSFGEPMELPEWWHYHNTHTGKAQLMVSPDERGRKESVYRKAWREKQDQDREVKYETGELPKPVPETRPHLSDNLYEDVLDFMELFETPETVRMLEICFKHRGVPLHSEEDDSDTDSLNEQVENIMLDLGGLRNLVLPVKENLDWRVALIEAWEEYETQKTIRMLPAAYDNYLFMIENKIAFPRKDHDWTATVELINNDILNGRELLGEPRDFDF